MNDLILLAMLLEGPKHGYQLKQQAGLIMGQGDMHNNLVYPLLRRFTDKGWVTRKAVAGERGQTRQQYALTPLGRKTLIERLSQYGERNSDSFPGFAMRVGMFEALKPATREHILKQRENYLQERDQKLAALQGNMDLGKYGGEVVGYLRSQFEAELNWIQRLSRMVKN
ncbi:MAG: PadR family transcriptional regulator [Terriglobales bacterium]|jgi:DNA-binding PadR family transcriptional regulator